MLPRLFCVCICVAVTAPANLRADEGHGTVASVHPLATDAGLNALRDGGNAVDAAVATALTLGVVDGHNSGIGGGCFILIHRADGEIMAIDGRETAPVLATRDMYLRDGKVAPLLSQLGPLAVATPGALAAYDVALRRAGKRTLSDAISPAAKIAADGFPIDRIYSGKLADKANDIRKFPATAKTLLKPDGTPLATGDTLRQPDLANTYQQIAHLGADWFYRGEFAQMVDAWMAENGGILTANDFSIYQPKFREPIRTTYRDFEIVGFPPPSSGGIHVAQILNIVERFELKRIYEAHPAQFMHILAEAMEIAFADRAHWLGDADFADVPRGLINKAYCLNLSSRIDVNESVRVKKHGVPLKSKTDLFGKHTTHIAAADQDGNWVSITATVNTTFGSKIIVPGTGVVLNNEMDDFSAQPGTPNAFGLVGAENNAIVPGKRPLSSMSPTIVLKDDQPFMTVGAAGGPKIITQVALAIIRHLDLGMPIDKAIAEPRFHHQWTPDTLFVESGVPESVREELTKMGHNVEVLKAGGISQAIIQDGDGFIGVHDPRVPGKAASR